MAKFTAQAGIDPLLRVDLDPGDEVAAERGSMVMMDAGLILKGKTRGGFFKSLARKFLNDETFFQQWIAAEDQAGTAYLAPSLPGGVKVLDVKDDGVMIADGCFLAATAGIVMKAEGAGTLAVSGFGSLEEVEVTPDRPLLIDNGHLVAWDASLDYEITLQTGRSGLAGRLIGSQLTGEGFVLKFSGSGRVILSSRSQGSFIDWIFSRRPIDREKEKTE